MIQAKSAGIKTANVRPSLMVWIRELIPMLLIVYFVFGICFRLVIVCGDSMNPTLDDGAIVVAQKIFYQPKRGDIIVCHPPSYGKTIIKRVIAVEGDVLDFDAERKMILLNGLPIQETYINEQMETSNFPQEQIHVESGHVFVMGDNRNHSLDSRNAEIGQIADSEIIGGVIVRII